MLLSLKSKFFLRKVISIFETLQASISKLNNCLFRSGKVKLPEWVDLVKTNVAKELAPFDEDWYYTRIASIARHIYVRSPVGVTTVCKIYGGKKTRILFYLNFFFKMEMNNGFISVRRNNGSAPSHWRAGSGSIGRKALQALEQLKLVEKDPNGGRRLTSQGRRDLDRIAAQVYAVSQKQI